MAAAMGAAMAAGFLLLAASVGGQRSSDLIGHRSVMSVVSAKAPREYKNIHEYEYEYLFSRLFMSMSTQG